MGRPIRSLPLRARARQVGRGLWTRRKDRANGRKRQTALETGLARPLENNRRDGRVIRQRPYVERWLLRHGNPFLQKNFGDRTPLCLGRIRVVYHWGQKNVVIPR